MTEATAVGAGKKTTISVVYEDNSTLIYTLDGSGVVYIKRKEHAVTIRLESSEGGFDVTASEGYLKPFMKSGDKQMFSAVRTL